MKGLKTRISTTPSNDLIHCVTHTIEVPPLTSLNG